jgi:hypothetical protein
VPEVNQAANVVPDSTKRVRFLRQTVVTSRRVKWWSMSLAPLETFLRTIYSSLPVTGYEIVLLDVASALD